MNDLVQQRMERMVKQLMKSRGMTRPAAMEYVRKNEQDARAFSRNAIAPPTGRRGSRQQLRGSNDGAGLRG